jgi:hypothetical protein
MTMPALEWEAELEGEFENEWELEGEYEGEFENEWELEGEFEGEFENELEGEEFLGTAARGAWGWLTRPGSTQRSMALRAARWGLNRGGRALGGMAGRALGGAAGGALGSRLGGALAGRLGAGAVPIGQGLGRMGGRQLGRMGGQQLGALAGGQLGDWAANRWLPAREYEFEGEYEVNPLNRVNRTALMEHLGHAATTARSEAEAESFIGALVPLAAQVVPQAARAITRATPGLVSGLSGVAQVLRRNPSTRPLVRTLPTIMRRTAISVARQAAQGQPVTPQAAVRTMARQTAQVLSRPNICANTLMRSRALDRQYHRAQNAAQRMFEF